MNKQTSENSIGDMFRETDKVIKDFYTYLDSIFDKGKCKNCGNDSDSEFCSLACAWAYREDNE